LGGRRNVQPIKKSYFANPQKFSSRTSIGREGRSEENQLTEVHLNKWPLNGNNSYTDTVLNQCSFKKDCK